MSVCCPTYHILLGSWTVLPGASGLWGPLPSYTFMSWINIESNEKVLPYARLYALYTDECKDSLAKSAAHRSLLLAAGGEAHMALLVYEDGQAEGVAFHTPGSEPELV